MKRIAVVTGANRGIGKEVARGLAEKGFEVIATGRNIDKIKATTEDIGHEVIPVALDVSSQDSCEEFGRFMEENYNRVDVLVNNAGIIGNHPMTEFDMDQIHKVLDTNFFGAMMVTKAVFPLLRKSADARVINVSSGMGAMDSMHSGYAAYRLSKWGLNGFTMLLAGELVGSNIKVNAICPGWCHTDMGGSGAPRTPAKGAETAIWLATEENIPSGKFFRDKKEIAW